MMLGTILAALAAIVILIGPFVVLAYLAIQFGADSRPGIGERDHRRWL
jgi:hypothetical protein